MKLVFSKQYLRQIAKMGKTGCKRKINQLILLDFIKRIFGENSLKSKLAKVLSKISAFLLVVPFLVAANAVMAEEKTPSGSIVIDETQIMWMVGGDIGGGTLEFQGQSYPFKLDGLKLGGFGVHKLKQTGYVYDLKDVADFAGVYAEVGVGFTVADAGKGDFWLRNDKGVTLHLKLPESQGIALATGVDGVDIRMK